MLHYLKIAGEVADISSDKFRKAFLGAVAIRRDGVLVSSRNAGIPCSTKTPSAHAEARVLRKAGFGAIVYVSRVLRDGHFAMAKPCGRCMAALKGRGVEMVYYTTGSDNWEGCRP